MSTKIAILSKPTKMKIKMTKCSISIASLETVFDQFDGKVKLDDSVHADPCRAIFWLLSTFLNDLHTSMEYRCLSHHVAM